MGFQQLICWDCEAKEIMGGYRVLSGRVCRMKAEKALDRACNQVGVSVKDFTVAPVYCEQNPSDGYHQWLVEFEKDPEDLAKFAAVLEQMVRAEDLDYKQARASMELNALEVIAARPALFYDWLDAKGKLGGQHKVPRLSRERKYMDELLTLQNSVRPVSD